MVLSVGSESRNIYDKIAALIKRDIPIRDCNFVLVDNSKIEDDEILLKSLTIPDSGVDFSFTEAIGYLPMPSIKMSAIGVEGYILKSKIDSESDFFSTLYYSQFTNGLLKISGGVQLTIAARVYPEIDDSNLIDLVDGTKWFNSGDGYNQNVLIFNGCYCSAPKYSSGYSSNRIASVSSTIYYRDFTNALDL